MNPSHMRAAHKGSLPPPSFPKGKAHLSSCSSMRCAWRTRPLLRHRPANFSHAPMSSCMGMTSCRMLNRLCHTCAYARTQPGSAPEAAGPHLACASGWPAACKRAHAVLEVRCARPVVSCVACAQLMRDLVRLGSCGVLCIASCKALRTISPSAHSPRTGAHYGTPIPCLGVRIQGYNSEPRLMCGSASHFLVSKDFLTSCHVYILWYTYVSIERCMHTREVQPGRAPKILTKLWPAPEVQIRSWSGSPAISFVALPGIRKDN